ncbi:MAG: hypothetical protein AB1782_10400 [Cyanobacteriota bacterium]
MMYGNQFYFDEMQQTGNKIRIKNKMKAKSLMALSVNFLDENVLAEVQKLFLSMTPQEMQKFKAYLNGRGYLKCGLNNSPESAIINKISRIALSSVPKDDYLRSIMKKYNENLNKIDELKIQTTKIIDGEEINKLIAEIDQYNEENLTLLEKVNEYREKKAA